MDHQHHHNGAVVGGGAAVDCITLQKNVTFHLADGNNGHDTAYFSYPTLPNSKSTFRLCGCFWSFKYFFEQSNTASNSSAAATSNHHHHHHQHATAAAASGTKIESDACQMYLYMARAQDHSSDIEFQLYCDSGSKANVGGWTLAQMKWISVKISFINPETKQIISHKKVEGETRCGKLLCQCRQSKLCLRKANFCTTEYLQSFYVINKCSKPRYGMTSSYFTSLDAFVTVTLFPQNPKSAAAATSVYDLYWKSQQEASKRIYHGKIGTDFILLAANGKEFPCHKCILAGHSEVFNKIFKTDIKRQISLPSSSSTKLVMENMSAVGVELFLKYLYYGDTSFGELHPNVAFELLKAAEKYNIPHLKRTSTEMLLSKPPDDFDCGTALNMYVFGVNNNSHSQYSSLRRTALQFFSKNYVELVKSADFVKLFAENRESAQEILIKIHTSKNRKA